MLVSSIYVPQCFDAWANDTGDRWLAPGGMLLPDKVLSTPPTLRLHALSRFAFAALHLLCRVFTQLVLRCM